MRKQILLVLALVVGTASAASAQDISANASIAKVLTRTGTQAVTFPAGTPGGAGGSTITATNTAAMGYAEYTYNSAVQVDITPPATLLHTDGLNTLLVSFTCGVADAAATGLTLGGCSTHTLTYVAATGGLQVQRVWVGGSIAQGDIDAAAAGAYSGTITVVASQP